MNDAHARKEQFLFVQHMEIIVFLSPLRAAKREKKFSGIKKNTQRKKFFLSYPPAETV